MNASAWNARVAAAQASIDAFDGQPAAFGRADCVRRAAFVAKRLGHPVSVLKLGSYSTERGAIRAMRKLGHRSLIEAMDERFERIAAASRWPGDIVALPSDDAFGCSLAIALSNGVLLSQVDGVCRQVTANQFVGGWRL